MVGSIIGIDYNYIIITIVESQNGEATTTDAFDV